MKNSLRIKISRLLHRIEEMAKIGAKDDGGVNRLALSDEDQACRDLFIEWCQEAGCTVRIDDIGNIFARKVGTNPDLPAVLFGSHLDSQPTGGKYDGAMGVLSGLEVIETIQNQNISHDHSLEIVSWTNEEGARFSPAMLGSGYFAGEFDAEYAFSRKDSEAKRVDNELKRIGYDGTRVDRPNYKAYFEIHLEQGPVLEHSGVDLGVVTGVQGIRWYDVTIHGTETHAGPTPMLMRDDPVQEMIQLQSKIFELANKYSPQSRVTIGSIKTKPGSQNTVPGLVLFTVDIRHPENKILNIMHKDLQQICSSNSKVLLNDIWHSPPVLFHDKCIEVINRNADALGISRKPIVSGAGHDAVYVNQVIPSGMIFTPCKNGISHHPTEFVEPDHIETAANVLLHSVLQTANKEFIL